MTGIKPDTPNAGFSAQADNYEMVTDFYRGVGAVRAKGEGYLPKTSGMINAEDQTKAGKRYEAFVARATFPGILRHTVSSIVGVTTSKEPKSFKIPAAWKSIEECVTQQGENLQGFRGSLVGELSKLGRVGIMTDLRSEEDPVPVLTPFYANQIINWRSAVIGGKIMLTLLVIKKQEDVEGGEYWEDTTLDVIEVFSLEKTGVLKRRFEKKKAATGKDSEWTEVDVGQPRSKKQATGAETTADIEGRLNGFRLMEIPFTPLNTEGISINPVDPPFLDLTHKLKDIYCGSANYREAMSMYEPTPVVSGMTKEWIDADLAPKYLGVGALWKLPVGAEAKMLEYMGPNIRDIRQALMDDSAEAERLATQPFEKMSAAPESGESKKEKSKAKTNVIREIHLSAGAGIQEALRKGARWTGENEDGVEYTVADDLDNVVMSPAELTALTSSNLAGIMIDEDTHARLKAGGYSNVSFEQWQAAREGGETGALAGGNA